MLFVVMYSTLYFEIVPKYSIPTEFCPSISPNICQGCTLLKLIRISQISTYHTTLKSKHLLTSDSFDPAPRSSVLIQVTPDATPNLVHVFFWVLPLSIFIRYFLHELISLNSQRFKLPNDIFSWPVSKCWAPDSCV